MASSHRPSSPAQPTEPGKPSAPWGWRILALVVDWVASMLVTLAVLGPSGYSDNPNTSWITLGVFVLETAIGVALAGGSFGQLATRIRVVGVDNRPIPVLKALVRSVLVALVIPPLVFRPDGRGLHDMAVGSRTYRL